MNTFKRIICFVLAAATIVLFAASCDEEKEIDLANITLSQEQLENVQAKIEKTLKEENFSGGAFVKLNKNTLYENYYGIEDPTSDKKIDKNTHYQVSSMTKNITGAAILQLSDEGKLNLNDTLNMYFDDSGDRAYLKKITIQQLIGLDVSFGAYHSDLLKDEKTRKEIDKLISKGADVKEYITDSILTKGVDDKSNQTHSNYYLLGLIIEKASGMEYKDYIQKNIFDKLEMTESAFVNKKLLLYGYNIDTEMLRDAKDNIYYMDYGFMYSSFGIVSTMGDMLKFYDAVLAGKITKTNMIKRLTSFIRITASDSVTTVTTCIPTAEQVCTLHTRI